MTLSDSSRRYAVHAVSLAVAAVFIYAGIDKIRDPLQFADSIAAFAILPAVLINLLAMGLPPFEIACGLLLHRAVDQADRIARGRSHPGGVHDRPVVRPASRSHARLRLLRRRGALATENVAGARVGRGAVVGRAVRLSALDLPAGLHVTINQRLVRGEVFAPRLDDSVMG